MLYCTIIYYYYYFIIIFYIVCLYYYDHQHVGLLTVYTGQSAKPPHRGEMNTTTYTHGICEPGYETVRAMFEQQFQDEVNEFAQICVYAKSHCVIDLYGSRPKAMNSNLNLKYDNTSVQNIFSSTKVLTSLVVAMLVDRGRLQYQQKVIDIWPEYSQNGKETTTIAEVMRHEAGIPALSETIPAKKLYADAIRNGSVSNIIEDKNRSINQVQNFNTMH